MEPDSNVVLAEAINAHAETLRQIFQIPQTDNLAAFFGLGIITPLTLYLVAFCVGSLVNFWRR